MPPVWVWIVGWLVITVLLVLLGLVIRKRFNKKHEELADSSSDNNDASG